jgi:hypothetical protein
MKEYQKWENKGFDIDHLFTVKNYGNTSAVALLCVAASNDQLNVVKALLDRGG